MDSGSEEDPSDSSVPSECEIDGEITPCTPYTNDEDDKFTRRPKIYVCDHANCGKRFNRPVRLAEHIRSHTNERPFVCDWKDCDKAFLRETHLKAHVKSVHTQIRDHLCKHAGCGKKFTTATKLKKHLSSHKEQEKYRCTGYPPCSEQFRKHSTLQKHVTVAHLGQKPYRCSHVDEHTGNRCAQGYDVQSSLEAHTGRVHGGVSHWCILCTRNISQSDNGASPIGFSTYALLQEHIRVAHPPTCPHCDKRCSSQRELSGHIEIAHGGQHIDDRRTFHCNFEGCDRSFTRKGNLDQHVRTTHEGKKPFVCGQTDSHSSKNASISAWDATDGCGRPFTTKGNLEEHIRTQHLGLESAVKRRRRGSVSSLSGRMADGAGGKSGVSEAVKSRGDKSVTDVSTLTRLTGHDYAPASGRTIPCLFPSSCVHLFHRDHDLVVHLKAWHKMAERDIEYALTERDARLGGRFWIGGTGMQAQDLEHELELQQIEMEMEREEQQERWEEDAERRLKQGGEFWVATDDGQGGHNDETDWDEMQRLVQDGTGKSKKQLKKRKRATENETLIDPLLRCLAKQ